MRPALARRLSEDIEGCRGGGKSGSPAALEVAVALCEGCAKGGGSLGDILDSETVPTSGLTGTVTTAAGVYWGATLAMT